MSDEALDFQDAFDLAESALAYDEGARKEYSSMDSQRKHEAIKYVNQAAKKYGQGKLKLCRSV